MRNFCLIVCALLVAGAAHLQTAAQKIQPGDITEIILETGDGFCYHCGRVTTLRADGTAIYHGDENSRHRKGDFTGAIEKTEFARLAQTVVEAEFFHFKPRYEGTFNDVAAVVITVVYAGGNKTVENFGRSQEPQFKIVEQAFKAADGTVKWKKVARAKVYSPDKSEWFTHLAKNHRAAVGQYIEANKNLRPALEKDGENEDGIYVQRVVYGLKYHPYYAVYDFDKDKIQDFAVVFLDEQAAPDARFMLVVFKGAANKTFKPAFTGSKMDLSLGGIELEPLGKNPVNLRVVQFQTQQGCSVLRWRKGQLVLSECPPEKS